MIAAITGAAGNWIALIYASLYATDSVTTAGEIGLIILSVIYYLALGLVLEIMAQWRFRDVRLRLAQIRSS
jgi:hypothetical protein